jgi:hypothetical protein
MEKDELERPAAPPLVVNVDSIKEVEHMEGDHWGSAWKPLTPALDASPGRLGANRPADGDTVYGRGTEQAASAGASSTIRRCGLRVRSGK